MKPNRERKSVGAEDTFRVDITTIEEARLLVSPLVEKVWSVCQNRELVGKTVTLKVKFSDFEQITRSKSRSVPLKDRRDFEVIVEDLLHSIFPPVRPIRLLGVTISNFEKQPEVEAEQMFLPID